MRTTLKIFLLLATIFLVAGSILFFFKTRLSPPQPLADGNHHVEMAEQCLAKIRGGLYEDTLNARFFEARHLLDFYGDNGLLTDEECDAFKTEMVERYAPLYTDKCFGHFKDTVWDEKDIRRIPRQISVAKSVRLADGTCVVECNKEVVDMFEEVLEVVCRYDSAKLLARGKTYQNWANTKRRLARAQRFINDDYLGYNNDLVKSLDSLRYRLEKSHYSYLGTQAGRLAGYRSMSEEDYDSLCYVVQNEFDHYVDSGRVVYGISPRSVDSLRQAMGINKVNAKIHYSKERVAEKIIDVGRSFWEEIME